MKRIVEPFDRLGAEASLSEETGIGLTITKRFVVFMVGRIGLEREIGKGTKIFIDLPRSAAPAEEEKVFHKQTETGSTPLKGNYTLLYVEDNMFNRELLEAILERSLNIKLLTAEATANATVFIIKTQYYSIPTAIIQKFKLVFHTPARCCPIHWF